MTGFDSRKMCPSCFQMTMNGRICTACGYSLEQSDHFSGGLAAGTVMNQRYVIGRILGQGGFGITYKALDLQRMRFVALKEYAPRSLGFERQGTYIMLNSSKSRAEQLYRHGMQRFREEYDVQKVIGKYEHTVNAVDFFQSNNTAYYAMDYIDGVNLRQYLLEMGRQYSIQEAVGIISRIGDTLGKIHANEHIIHRDISPENMLLDRGGQIYLIDFGSAKTVVSDEMQEFSIVVKPSFAPLEQYTTNLPQGTYTDVYALAGTLYFLLLRKKVPTAIDRMNTAMPLFTEADIAYLPEYLRAALAHALLINYRERTQTVPQFLAEISGKENTLPVGQPVRVRPAQRVRSGKTPVLPVLPRKKAVRTEPVSAVEVEGPEKGRSWNLKSDVWYTVGRDQIKCSIYLPRPEVSRTHLRIMYSSQNHSWILRDESRNGTRVEGRLLKNGVAHASGPVLVGFETSDCILRLEAAANGAR